MAVSSGPSKPLSDNKKAMHVAVIGAGAAGLVAAREALLEGHQVTVLEAGSRVGGVWIYTDEIEDDLTGASPKRRRVHSSMYRDLRTNLPRHVMGYTDFPFTVESLEWRSQDSRLYCSHSEVLAYLEAFTDAYRLRPFIKFGSLVSNVMRLPGQLQNGCNAMWPRWRITVQRSADGFSRPTQEVLEVDAIIICNGHYNEPSLPDLEGMADFPGLQMHTHNYRNNSRFAGQRVCVIGAQASGIDISQEIAEVAAEVLP